MSIDGMPEPTPGPDMDRREYAALPVERAGSLRRAWRAISSGGRATAVNGAPFPLRSWPPDAALDIQHLAEWVDPMKPETVRRFPDAAARDAAIPAPAEGMMCYLLDPGMLMLYRSEWIPAAGEAHTLAYGTFSALAAGPNQISLTTFLQGRPVGDWIMTGGAVIAPWSGYYLVSHQADVAGVNTSLMVGPATAYPAELVGVSSNAVNGLAGLSGHTSVVVPAAKGAALPKPLVQGSPNSGGWGTARLSAIFLGGM